MHRAAVLDLLGRFPAMSRSHVADALFKGNVRTANRVLLSLTRAQRLYRFPLVPHGEYVYSLTKRATAQLEHHLAIAGLYAALVRGAPPDRTVTGAANVELQKGLITDLLVVAGDFAVLAEVHLGTNSFGTKLERYANYRAGRKWEEAPWWEPGVRVIVWVVAPPAAVARLEHLAAPYRAAGMRVAVSPLPGALQDAWGSLGLVPVVVRSESSSTRSIMRWRIPQTAQPVRSSFRS